MSNEAFFEDAWAILIEEDSAGEALQEGELTVEMYAEKIGKSSKTAHTILRRRYADEELTRRPIVMNGARLYAYKPVI